MINNNEEKKSRGPNRYPLKNHEVAKRTIARLTREVLRGDIDPEKCRAAIYCINSLIQIFKIEAPQKIETQFKGDVKCEAKTQITYEELQRQADEIMPEFNEYLEWVENKKRHEQIEQVKALDLPLKPVSLPEPEQEVEEIVKIEDIGTWKPAGIGTRSPHK
jgi:hypothetical protein